MKYIHLDDNAISVGGTNLTSLAILEDRVEDVISISCKELTINHINKYKDKLWIIGNFTNLFSLQEELVLALLKNKFVKIEFDYNFCQYRGEIPHKILGNGECSCPHGLTGVPIISRIYNEVVKNSLHTFFMSNRQRSIYSTHMPYLKFEKTSVLTSCFTKSTFYLFQALRQNKKSDTYAIPQGFGGWHSEAKGVRESINFCESNNLKYRVLPNQPYEKHLDELSRMKGLVFLPIIDDTCPRCVIEAKLLGVDVISNINSQHITEWWWKKPIEEIEQYLESRPKYFWRIIDEITS
jgi:hypothetical protein